MKIGRSHRWLALAVILALACPAAGQRIMEKINRGLIAMPVSGGTYLSWRLLGTDDYATGFNVYKGAAKLNATPISGATIYIDGASGTGGYTVKPILNGEEGEASEPARVLSGKYWPIPLTPPANGTFHGADYSFAANDASAADLDGDSQYDIVFKWEPGNSRDNSQAGYTGPTILEGVRLDGFSFFRINLGQNIRSGAHYTQFMVYDLDGDGKAEIVCKTAPGTRDGTGAYIKMGPAATASHATDYTNSDGKVLSGPEYLTVFDGQTGKELSTVAYLPGRGSLNGWGGVGGNGNNDDTGNRVDRFTACIAYLDGVKPSVVMGRGYYGRSALAAWDWRDGKLTSRWVFDTQDAGNPYSGQGAHGISVADVDDDGKDEIIFGAMTVNDDGTGLYNTGFRHGDALHVGDFDPKNPGLEVYMIHENEGSAVSSPGTDLHDARTGAVLWKTAIGADVGRGVAGDIKAGNPGAEFWGTGKLLDTKGADLGAEPASANFLAWWDGDLLRELLDGTAISKFGGSNLLSDAECASNNGTKSTPALTADLFGDWREEVMWRTADSKQFRIHTTSISTTFRVYTLMHDPAYRMAVAWQNVAYNQPPHVGFHLGEGMAFPLAKPKMTTRGHVTGSVGREPGGFQILGGRLIRFTGGSRIAMPWGYALPGRWVKLRDAFGRVVASGSPKHGYFELPKPIPQGMYYLEIRTE